MSKKTNSSQGGLVYSTSQEFFKEYNKEDNPSESLPKDKQKLKVKLDSKQRRGKMVTLIEGFIGPEDDMEALGKLLKTKCGAGGSVKDGLIMLQGDYREKIIAWLKDWGYVLTK